MAMRNRTIWLLGAALAVGCAEDGAGPDAHLGPTFAVGGVGRPAVLVNPHANDHGTARTIQQGIDMVAEGGKVLVVPGTYVEAIVINKGLTLEGIGGENAPAVLSPDGTPVATIEVVTPNRVTIRHMTVLKPGSNGILGNNRVVDIALERVTVLAVGQGPGTNRLVRIRNHASQTGGRARLVVRESFLDGGGFGPGNAISLLADIDAVIEGNVVRRLGGLCFFITGGTSAGINADIVNNDFDECYGRTAIDVGPTPTQMGNFGTVGVVNIVGNTIRNSTASCAATTAIHYQLYAGRIARNSIVGFLQQCAEPLSDALPAAIWVGSLRGFPPASPVVRFNDIAGNAHAGLRIAPNITTPIDASCNYWGAADGPSGAGVGSGDAMVVEAGAAVPAFTPFARAPIAGTPVTTC